MPQTGVIYRVLIASPGDCKNERKLIPRIIREWNAAHSFHTGAILEPVLWESHARPEMGDRPQAIINKQLVEICDFLVGVFWTRLGTSTGEARSGMVEEIERFRQAGKSALLYFSSAPVEPDSIDLSQFQSPKQYGDELQSQGLCFKYDSLAHLRILFQGHLAGLMAHAHKSDGKESVSNRNTESNSLQQFEDSFSAFLRRYTKEWQSERDSEPMGTQDGKAIIIPTP